MTRTDKLLYHIRKDMKVLEIGPSFRPTCIRADGWDVYSLDHATRDELREKYCHHAGIDIDLIEEVDFIWRGGPMPDVIPPDNRGTFDACIASHVIEHMPDPIAFFESLSKLMKPQSIVSLAVPDKRWCFDFFRPLTTTARWLEAAYEKRTKHTRATRFEFETYVIKRDGEIAWSHAPLRSPAFASGGGIDLLSALSIFDDPVDTEIAPYVDTHAWCFTPSSFAQIILEAHALSVIDYRIRSTFHTAGHEFFVTLEYSDERERDAYRLQQQRMNLLLATAREIKEQVDLLPDQ